MKGNVDAYQDPSTAPIPAANVPRRTGHINAASALEHGNADRDDDAPWTLAMIHIYLPFLVNWFGIFALIFGGCCSNVSYGR